jgi:hypothetical protein
MVTDFVQIAYPAFSFAAALLPQAGVFLRSAKKHNPAEGAAAGLPARHAGSFGFDIVSLAWFTDSRDGSITLRIAAGDLPSSTIRGMSSALKTLLQARL